MLSRLRQFSSAMTTHDAVKLLAILLMFIDHTGFFFYPEQLWWRSIGRWCFPFFFFLIGYAPGSTMRLHLMLWILGGGMILLDAVTRHAIFPVNVLFTILACRWAVHRWQVQDYDGEKLLGLFLLLVVWAFPTALIAEYGTMALMYALCGYLVRRFPGEAVTKQACLLTVLCYVPVQALGFRLDMAQTAVMGVGCVVQIALLYHYRSAVLSRQLPPALRMPLLLLARYSLYVYVVHYCLLQLVEWQMNLGQYQHFTWVVM